MHQVAADILARASTALQTHEQTWQSIQTYIHDTAPTYSTWSMDGNVIDVRSYLTNVLEPHAQRLKASYEWQIKVASALFDAVDTIENTEQGIVNTFHPSGNPTNDSPKGPHGHGQVF